jgi:PIN domain
MKHKNSLLFIDANQYLDLFRTNSSRSIVKSIVAQRANIFVTAQVVDEVQRNKVDVAAGFFVDQLKKLAMASFGLPDHLFDKDVQSKITKIAKSIAETKDELNRISCEILEQIGRSTDEISKALEPIFATAVKHTPNELQRARTRKELGRAPGKKGDPIGDQLSWEQILSRCKSTTRLWLITKDGDFTNWYATNVVLNAALHAEISNPPYSVGEVYCFKGLTDGIRHFVEKTGARTDALPTPEDAEQFKSEQESLPPVGTPNNRADAAFITHTGGMQRFTIDQGGGFYTHGSARAGLVWLPRALSDSPPSPPQESPESTTNSE